MTAAFFFFFLILCWNLVDTRQQDLKSEDSDQDHKSEPSDFLENLTNFKLRPVWPSVPVHSWLIPETGPPGDVGHTVTGKRNKTLPCSMGNNTEHTVSTYVTLTVKMILPCLLTTSTPSLLTFFWIPVASPPTLSGVFGSSASLSGGRGSSSPLHRHWRGFL